MRDDKRKGPGDGAEPRDGYEPPELEDLVKTEGPSVTAALVTTTPKSAPREL